MSCKRNQNPKPLKEENVQIDSIITIQNIDAFPLFEVCDSLETKEVQKECFIQNISNKIYTSLHEENFKSKKKLNDTIQLIIKVDTVGNSHLTKVVSSELIKAEFPRLDSVLYETVEVFPKAKPATSRGIPTNIEFEVPIIIKN
ncbi:hypothetical protein [Aureivirga marina]|uniref:hypothetical protein n=1 Tax=Aureivirga marina TaxID=1182451 RepID=UPI0018CA4765|nr:hypothetical protein [Aureivirga marina]